MPVVIVYVKKQGVLIKTVPCPSCDRPHMVAHATAPLPFEVLTFLDKWMHTRLQEERGDEATVPEDR